MPTPMEKAGSCLALIIAVGIGWLLVLALVLVSVIAIRAVT